MSLCDLCLSIPFDSLPAPPEPGSSSIVSSKRDLVQLWYETENKIGVPLHDPIGFPYHENLDALAASSPSCTLCAAVQSGVDLWIEDYRDAEKSDQYFLQFLKDEISGGGQRLWLTKRFSGTPGFLVLVRIPDYTTGVYLMTGVGFTAEAGLNDKISLQPMTPNSGDQNSLDLAASWLEGCVNRHEKCAKGDALLPSRILDISAAGDMIKLLDSEGISGKYASLSYCWGSSTHFTTSKESLAERQFGISLSDLPQTILDAVIIARHLGFQYLWVDSLCILRGDAEDWARESARMIDVYSNAHLVIAANHAKNSSVGCFHTRASRLRGIVNLPSYGVDVHTILLHPHDEWIAGGRDFHGEPLILRGWALQERVLARRVLHYNAQKMYFECNHGIVGEDGCNTPDRWCNLEKLDIARWNGLLWGYGERNLTKPTDKLPAMSGLAKLFERELGAQYVAGIWSNALIEGLAWQCLRKTDSEITSQEQEYIGPSWSWASFDGIAATGLEPGWEDVSEILEWHVEPKTKANPYGEVINAWIRIRAPIFPLVPSKRGDTDHEIKVRQAGIKPNPRFCTPFTKNDEGQGISLDSKHVKESEEWRAWNLQAMVLGRYTNSEDSQSVEPGKDIEKEGSSKEEEIVQEREFSQALVVTSMDGGTTFKRVGWLFLEGVEVAKAIEDQSYWHTVTLV
ncbi:hypothetical protein LSUE1_G004553 [Lachnellula suecica]|uniref:Heterokaryon incompatibility domain-containing protein n=1 Tax=Lachnellula suecica TaxID=602035 RepID=A0A8T9CA21_9HELO|nr:hypothetical protein LSUE1_G004553 [Lachnellula suecica]